MNSFVLNGYLWQVKFVDPLSINLVDRTGHLTVATTDPNNHIVYLSNALRGDFLYQVLIHELGHCTMVSFDLIDDIRKTVKPEYWIEAEEWICNLIADYGLQIFSIAYDVLGEDAWLVVPHELELFVG